MPEAALTAVDLGKGWRVHVPSDGHQQSRRLLLSSRASRVLFPRSATSNFAAAVVGEVVSSLSLARTHYLAPPLFATGHREDVSAGRSPD